jgi:hypothetical protein
MRATRLLAALLLTTALVAASPAPKATPTAPHALQKRVAFLVAQAPTNFAAIRGRKNKNGDDYSYDMYDSTPAFAAQCRPCHIEDDYADGQSTETWAVRWRWLYDKTDSDEHVVNDVLAELTPVLKGFKLTRSVRDNQTVLDWEKPNGVWVYVKTFDRSDNDDIPGFSIGVGHDLAKPVHTVKPTVITQAERDDLTTGVTSFVKLGTAASTDNFTTLRGKEDTKNSKAGDAEFYDCSIAFTGMSDCEISGLLNYDRAKWVFEAKTVPLGGPPDASKELVRSIVAAALPYGFTATTDPKYLLTEDYRWDNSSTSTAVDISTGVTSRGRVYYDVEIFHFLH